MKGRRIHGKRVAKNKLKLEEVTYIHVKAETHNFRPYNYSISVILPKNLSVEAVYVIKKLANLNFVIKKVFNSLSQSFVGTVLGP